jgi:hypothetical protein
MQHNVWMSVFRRIAPEYHDTIMIVTTEGTEIAVQNLLRIEDDLAVIRGRISGSSDAGRVFFIPYSQINFAGFQKPLKEEELNAILGMGELKPQAKPQAETVADIGQNLSPRSTNQSKSSSGSSGSGGNRSIINRPPLPLKSELLERLRTRSHQAVSMRPPLE